MSAGCPAPEDLLDLLEVADASGDHAALQEHVAACAHCGAELASLRVAFTALDPARGAAVEPRAADLSRMRAAVSTALAAEHKAPVTAPARLWLRLAGAGVAALLTLAQILTWLILGQRDADLRAPGLLLGLSVALLVVPRGRSAALAAGLAVAAAAGVALLGTTLETSLPGHLGCLPAGLFAAVLSGVVLARTAGAAGARGSSTGLAVGVAAGLSGVAVQQALCGEHALDHRLVLHLAPLVALAGLGALGGALSARRPQRSAA